MNPHRTTRCWHLILGAILCCGATAQAATVTVFAAASLSESLKEICAAWQQAQGDSVRLNLGGSSTLARQIEEGAPADIFFSADEAQMNRLEARGLILEGSRKSLISNRLVLVVAADAATIKTPQDLAVRGVKRVALADPEAVPAGVYARQYLDRLGLWSKVKPKVAATENVRAALAAVEAGNADAAIVYKTDAAIARKARVVFEAPAAEGPAISYPVALLKDSKVPGPAARFLEFLGSERALTIFERHGFVVLRHPQPGRDAFHRVPNFDLVNRDAVERVPTGGELRP